MYEEQCKIVEGGRRAFGESAVQIGRLFLVSNRLEDRCSDRCTVSPGPDVRLYPWPHSP